MRQVLTDLWAGRQGGTGDYAQGDIIYLCVRYLNLNGIVIGKL